MPLGIWWRTNDAVAEVHRVAGIRAALVAHHPIGALGEHVHELSLPFVAPLRADDDESANRCAEHACSESVSGWRGRAGRRPREVTPKANDRWRRSHPRRSDALRCFERRCRSSCARSSRRVWMRLTVRQLPLLMFTTCQPASASATPSMSTPGGSAFGDGQPEPSDSISARGNATAVDEAKAAGVVDTVDIDRAQRRRDAFSPRPRARAREAELLGARQQHADRRVARQQLRRAQHRGHTRCVVERAGRARTHHARHHGKRDAGSRSHPSVCHTPRRHRHHELRHRHSHRDTEEDRATQ